jgi:hypothetical protein
MRRIFGIGLVALLLMGFTHTASAASKTLDIPPVQQNLTNWCWLAVGEMIFEYYDVPNINPAGIYQCGVAAAVLGGICLARCDLCNVGSGTVENMSLMLTRYPHFVRENARLSSPPITADATPSSLSQADLKDEIDEDRPVVAGISPHSSFLPPGLSEHAVLIVGYREIDDELFLIINDPFPYDQVGMTDPYTANGGHSISPGQYRISYDSMVQGLAWRNSISGIDSE